ncbi:hypothetical protein [Streptomyces minutiscleroticus]|uniref:hypothetical protein n=1 Tax=Streptomyces minutiscleroticus TaxID=68238 RepID=UPI00331D2C69
MPRRMTRPAGIRPLAAFAVAALALTACGASSDATTAGSTPSTSPQGVVTPQTAKRVVDTYIKVNNQANKTRNARLLGTVEAGQLYQQSKADFEQWDTWDKDKQDDYREPFSYQDRTYLIPRQGTGSWFAVKARSGAGDDDQVLLVFDRVNGAYKLVVAAYPDTGEKLPDIAVDQHGLATAVDAATPVGSLAPKQLGAAYADLYETGGTKEGTHLAATKPRAAAVEAYKQRNDNRKIARLAEKRFYDAPPAHSTVYSLRTADGGVLSAVPAAHTQELMLKPAYMATYKINPTEEEAVYNSSGRALIVDEFQGQALAVLKPRSKARLISTEWRMVDSR